MSSYLRPTELDKALAALAEGGKTIVAGGTDFYPARVGKPTDEDVLDITAISGLREIEERSDHYLIGATATWTDLIRSELPGWFRSMKACPSRASPEQQRLPEFRCPSMPRAELASP